MDFCLSRCMEQSAHSEHVDWTELHTERGSETSLRRGPEGGAWQDAGWKQQNVSSVYWAGDSCGFV